ncbi:hypothetical protein VPH35_108364 [Triticum aestivum]
MPQLDLLLPSAATSSPTPSSFFVDDRIHDQDPVTPLPSFPRHLPLPFFSVSPVYSHLPLSLFLFVTALQGGRHGRPGSSAPTLAVAALPTSSPKKTTMPAAGASSRPPQHGDRRRPSDIENRQIRPVSDLPRRPSPVPTSPRR